MKIKHAFEKAAAFLKKPSVALMTAFTLALGAVPAAGQGNAPASDPTYWKLNSYDIVVKLETCPQSGLCGSIHSYNPKHKKIKDVTAMLLNKTETVSEDFTGLSYKRWAPETVTNSDIESLCGYTGFTDMKQKKDGSWTGNFVHPHQGAVYGLDIEQQDADTLVAKGYLPSFSIFKFPMNASRVDPSYPPCKNSPPTF